MDRIRKARGDSNLKTLPEERQREIYDRLCRETLAAVQAWLAQDGLRVGTSALSEFYSWFAMREVFRETEDDTANMLELLKHEMPGMPPEKVAELGDAFFNLQAIKLRNPKLFLAMQSAKHRAQMDKLKYEQREREMALERERLEAQIKSDIDKGLDALFAEIQGDPVAVDLFNRFKARVMAAKE